MTSGPYNFNPNFRGFVISIVDYGTDDDGGLLRGTYTFHGLYLDSCLGSDLAEIRVVFRLTDGTWMG